MCCFVVDFVRVVFFCYSFIYLLFILGLLLGLCVFCVFVSVLFFRCVCGGGGGDCVFFKNNNNISLFCLFVWVFSGGCEVICGFFGGQDVCSFWGVFRVSVCADVKINTIVKFNNLYILQLLSTL